MIKPEFTLLQVEIKRMLAHPSESHQPCLGKGPETLDAIDMGVPIGKLIVATLHPEMSR